MSCNVAGNPGTCLPVPAGSDDPRHLCAMTASTTCGTNGKCNGAGACSFYPSGTTCGANVCAGNNMQSRTTVCNGLGACGAGSQSNCTPYTCDPGTGNCRTSCTVPSDCRNSFNCVGGSCQ